MKHPFTYSLITKDGKLHTGTIKAHSMSEAKRGLEQHYPDSKSIAVKMKDNQSFYQSHKSSMML